ncbi:MAG: TonB-dependent receptor [Candidatus Sedimenticola sp. (ex Thyasira tokunagai)]
MSISCTHTLIALLICSPVSSVWAKSDDSLYELDLEQLMALEVTTVARKPQSLSRTPAAAFVISREDIRRSGAVSIPEALRLAPGVEAAQISPSKWSVTIRGFGGRFANKLLVLVDGRSIYTETFGGVYWEMHDLPLEDIERIEVIRGPGATLWGSNAVNGVINIITRHTSDTQGGLLQTRQGDQHQETVMRWGGGLGERGDYRVYLKSIRQDDFSGTSGMTVDSGQARQLLGLRADWYGADRDHFTLRSDLMRMTQGRPYMVPNLSGVPAYNKRIDIDGDNSSASLLGRWERSLAVDSELSLQLSLDEYERRELTHTEQRDTLELDFQHRFSLARRHNILWGLTYRRSWDEFSFNPNYLIVQPVSQTLATRSIFVQDEIELLPDRLNMVLGTKLEHGTYSGLKWQPNLRLLWMPDSRQSLWASVSRAIRSPTRVDRDGVYMTGVTEPFTGANTTPLPLLWQSDGNSAFKNELLTAYELGYRVQPRRGLSVDLALYHNDYNNLRDGLQSPVYLDGTNWVANTLITNTGHGAVYGAELALDWRPTPPLPAMESEARAGNPR